MADYYSTFMTNFRAVPRVANPANTQGQSLVKFTDYLVPTGGVAANKTIGMIPFKKGERFLGGWVIAESGALDTGTVLQIDDGATAGLYGEGSANDGDFEYGMTYALKYGLLHTGNGVYHLRTKNGTAGLIAAKTVYFAVRYMAGGS